MNRSNYRINLNINEVFAPVTIALKRGETGREIHITLIEYGKPYQISENCYAHLLLKKENETIGDYSCIIQDNTVKIPIEKSMTSTKGNVKCEVELCAENNETIVSSTFILAVYDTVYSEEEAESSNEFKSLSDLIHTVNSKLDKGDFQATVAVGNVTTVNEYSPARVINVGTNKDAILNFEIPRGERGWRGDSGTKITVGGKEQTTWNADTKLDLLEPAAKETDFVVIKKDDNSYYQESMIATYTPRSSYPAFVGVLRGTQGDLKAQMPSNVTDLTVPNVKYLDDQKLKKHSVQIYTDLAGINGIYFEFLSTRSTAYESFEDLFPAIYANIKTTKATITFPYIEHHLITPKIMRDGMANISLDGVAITYNLDTETTSTRYFYYGNYTIAMNEITEFYGVVEDL